MRFWIISLVVGLLAGACSDSTSELTPGDIATVRAVGITVTSAVG